MLAQTSFPSVATRNPPAPMAQAPVLSGVPRLDDLSALIAAVYDTTLEPSRWPEVLVACRGFVGGVSASIFSKDITGRGQVYHNEGSVDPHYAQLYFERYVRMDPVNVGHLFAQIDEPISTTDIVDYAEFTQSRFYREWVEPQGLVDMIGAPIERSNGRTALFGVFRSAGQGLADEGTRDRMRLLVPHIRRAVLIGRVIETGSGEAASFGDALDGLSAGMFLVDARGRVVHANAAGSALIEGGEAITARDGRIVAHDRAAAGALAEVFSAAGEGDAAVGIRGISVAMQGRDGVNYVAHVLPLTSGARRRTGASYAAVAALFIQRASLDAPTAPQVIANTFGLTPSELRVLVTIVQVGGVAETAETLGIGDATVKTHLHRVFSKTGTQRQADLVRLVAAYASPLAR